MQSSSENPNQQTFVTEQSDKWQSLSRTAEQDRKAMIIENDDKDLNRTRTEAYLGSKQGQSELELESAFDEIAANIDAMEAAGKISSEVRNELLESQMNIMIGAIDKVRAEYEESKKRELLGQMAGTLQTATNSAEVENPVSENSPKELEAELEDTEEQPQPSANTAKEGVAGETFQVGYGMSKEAEFKRLTGEDWPGVKYAAEVFYDDDLGYDDPVETYTIVERGKTTPSQISQKQEPAEHIAPDTPSVKIAPEENQQIYNSYNDFSNIEWADNDGTRSTNELSPQDTDKKQEDENIEQDEDEKVDDEYGEIITEPPLEETEKLNNEESDELAINEKIPQLLGQEGKLTQKEQALKGLSDINKRTQLERRAEIESKLASYGWLDEAKQTSPQINNVYGNSAPENSQYEKWQQYIVQNKIGGAYGINVLLDRAPLTYITEAKYANYWNSLNNSEKGNIIKYMKDTEDVVDDVPGRSFREWLSKRQAQNELAQAA